jgi:hypothetical protein
MLLLVGAAANDRRLTAVPIRLLLFVIGQESVQKNEGCKLIFPNPPSFSIGKSKSFMKKRNILC